MSEALPAVIAEAIQDGSLILLVISKRRAETPPSVEKYQVRPIMLRNQRCCQFTATKGTQQTHENLLPGEAIDRVAQLFPRRFADCHLFTADADYTFRYQAGKGMRTRKGPPSQSAKELAHNRQKKYLIPEGVPCRFLAEIGVMNDEGQVKKAKYHKFRQINRFLEFIEDVIPALPDQGTIEVVDFGCGKSYLTFALRHLLCEIHDRDVHIVGLDHNRDVIAACQAVAEKLSLSDIEFHVGDIAGHQATGAVDMAVSLHACDTATDAALGKAVHWQAGAILCAPCCQHELFDQLEHADLAPLIEHGILRERFAALATDALRARALEICGYKTQVLEFIDSEHTPKNLLIRAVRRPPAEERADLQREAVDGYLRMKAALGLTNVSWEAALGDRFLRLIDADTESNVED